MKILLSIFSIYLSLLSALFDLISHTSVAGTVLLRNGKLNPLKMLPFPPAPFNNKEALGEIINWIHNLLKITVVTIIVITKSIQKRQGVLSIKGYSPLNKCVFMA